MSNQQIPVPGLRRNDDGSFTLCPPCDKNGCCPTLAFDAEGGATISDEGQIVRFTEAQLSLLGQTLALHAAKIV